LEQLAMRPELPGMKNRKMTTEYSRFQQG